MSTLLSVMNFILAQNEAEKRITIISLIVMAVLLFLLIIDSTARYKSQYVAKSRKLKIFLWLFLIVVVSGGLILFRIYYK